MNPIIHQRMVLQQPKVQIRISEILFQFNQTTLNKIDIFSHFYPIISITEKVFQTFLISMQKRIREDLLIIYFSFLQNFHQTLIEFLLFKQMVDITKSEYLMVPDVLVFNEIKDILLASFA